MAFHREELGRPKIIVVMPVYNAAKTLKITYEDIPHHAIDQIILVDDGSTDKTLEIARELHLTAFVHTRNFGYGANQKTCYTEAPKRGRGYRGLRQHLAIPGSVLLLTMNSLQRGF
jgi:cellulose synthase/poly-beta-1,6-N-acetylglucosamine synthase-like glycosyltransferase